MREERKIYYGEKKVWLGLQSGGSTTFMAKLNLR